MVFHSSSAWPGPLEIVLEIGLMVEMLFEVYNTVSARLSRCVMLLYLGVYMDFLNAAWGFCWLDSVITPYLKVTGHINLLLLY